ncbi:MAG: hypothetical protein GX352_00310 [Clostridiales bacterium]|nr:hypothetical protein [Clostridiales bacterium]
MSFKIFAVGKNNLFKRSFSIILILCLNIGLIVMPPAAPKVYAAAGNMPVATDDPATEIPMHFESKSRVSEIEDNIAATKFLNVSNIPMDSYLNRITVDIWLSSYDPRSPLALWIQSPILSSYLDGYKYPKGKVYTLKKNGTGVGSGGLGMGSEYNQRIIFDDNAERSINTENPSDSYIGSYRSHESLADLEGNRIGGSWDLYAKYMVTGKRASLVDFGLTAWLRLDRDIRYETYGSRPLTVNKGDGVLINDWDPQGRALTAELVSQPPGGTVTLNPDGSFTYTAKRETKGIDTFYYRAYNGSHYSDPAKVLINVKNRKPTAKDHTFTVYKTYTFERPPRFMLEAPGILVGSQDPDGDVLKSYFNYDPVISEKWRIGIFADGGCDIHPQGIWTDTDIRDTKEVTFQYVVHDGKEYSDPANVRILIKNPPTISIKAQPEDKVIGLGSSVSLTMGDIFSIDPADERLTFTSDLGSIAVNESDWKNTLWNYTPDGVGVKPVILTARAANGSTESVSFNVMVQGNIESVPNVEVTVPLGTSLSEAIASLGSEAPVILEGGIEALVPINWSQSSNPAYNSSIAGNYTFTSSFGDLPAWIKNSNNIGAPSGIVKVAPKTILEITVPITPAKTGTPYELIVTAKDGKGQIKTDYTGTVHFFGTEGTQGLPGSYTFTAADKGKHTFNVTFETGGQRTIKVSEDDGLKGHYTFDEGSGTVISDSSGNGNAGTITSPDGWSTNKPVLQSGNGSSLDLNSAAYKIPSSTNALDNITLSAWIHPNGDIKDTFLYNGNSSSSGYGLMVKNDHLTLLCGGVAVAETSAHLIQNKWQHVAAVRSSGVWTLYLDGTAYRVAGNPTPNSITNGQFLYGNNNGCFIDDVRIYARPLLEREIGLLALGHPLTVSASLSASPLSGKGTKEDPYIITTADELDSIRNQSGANYKLGADIDLSSYGLDYDGGKGWLPINGGDYWFTGSLDGVGHTISGLKINRPDTEFVGLFGRIGSNGTVKNIKLKDVDVVGGVNAGGLAGQIVGMQPITGARADIQMISVTGKIKGTQNTGGLAGSAFRADISQVFCDVEVEQAPNYSAGGIVGFLGDRSVISNSYAVGSVTNTGGRTLGGLAGHIDEQQSSIKNSYAAVSVQGRESGGLAGINQGTVTSSYYDSGIAGVTAGAGTPLSTAQMMKQSTFVDWDFTNIWRIVEDGTYPILKYLPVETAEIDGMVKADMKHLKIGYTDGDSQSSVTSNLTLPTSGEYGTAIKWASSDSSAITAKGIVNRLVGKDQTVIMTAEGSKDGGITLTKTFDLTVLGIPIVPAIDGPMEMILERGYSACSTEAYTVTGFPLPTVSIVSGNERVTWNDTTKKLYIGEGLAPGDYEIILKAENGTSPDAMFTFKLTIASGFAGGNGALDDPYHIQTPGQLNLVRDYLDKYFVLDNDIGLTEACEPGGDYYNNGDGWLPIGDGKNKFTGNLDGAGHTISGLKINRPNTEFTGLFGCIGSYGTVRDIKLKDIDIRGGTNTGGLTGQVAGMQPTPEARAEIEMISITGKIKGGQNTGGLLGSAFSADISQVFCDVEVEQDINPNAGGVAGYLGSGSDISNSYATGKITKRSEGEWGGLTGQIEGGASVTNSYAAVKLNGNGGGGLTGANKGAVTSSYYDKDVAGVTAGAGTALSAAGMKQRATFKNWDFDNIWYIVDGVIYPILRFMVPGMEEVDSAIKVDLDDLEIGYSGDDKADSVTEDLTLPNSGEKGTTITWQSSDPEVISDYGKVTRVDGMHNTVTLTATLNKAGGNPRTKSFTLTVMGHPIPPSIVGPTDMTLPQGYDACSTGAYTITSLYDATVTKVLGDENFTWNDETKKLDIAEGLAEGTYPVELKVSNGTKPDATLTFTLTVISEFVEGYGTRREPYHIQTPGQLNNIRNHLNKYFILDKDIDLTEVCLPDGDYYNGGAGWQPIGDSVGKFTGSLDGAGHTISGLKINRPNTEFTGLFGCIGSNAEVRDIKLTDVDIAGGTNTGGLTGQIAGMQPIPGAKADIQTISVIGKIKGGQNTGGLAGSAFSADISQVFCDVGVEQNEKPNAGGIVGYLASDSNIFNSYAIGKITKRSGTEWGGLTGQIRAGASITNSYASVKLSGNGGGGLTGTNYGTVTSSYYDKDVAGRNDTEKGTPKTTQEMKQEATFEGWDFENTWRIIDGAIYPAFLWQPYTYSEINGVINYFAGWDYIGLDNYSPENITGDFNLPESVADGLEITWETDRPDLLDPNTGTVTRPNIDTDVKLTAYLHFGDGEPLIKEYNVVIKSAAPVYTLRLNGNGSGEDEVIQSLGPDNEFILTDDQFTLLGKEIIGWNTMPDGSGVSYPVDETISMPPYDLTLYAIWRIYMDGDGSKDNPYKIGSPLQLAAVRDRMIENGGDVYFAQTEDIDLGEDGNWTPIGNSDSPFMGTYDGNGKIISNLKISSVQSADAGLFGFIGPSGKLENIRLDDVDIDLNKPNIHVGGLAGTNQGTIKSCSSDGNISVNVNDRMEADVGGLTGINETMGIITGCTAGGIVKSNVDGSFIGGIAGTSGGTISDTNNTANIIGGLYKGGLAGRTTADLKIEDSCNTGDINTLTSNASGGLVGYTYDNTITTINNSYNFGDVSGTYSGGLIGYTGNSQVSITDSYNSGNISGTYSGGLAGYTDTGTLNITGSYNSAAINGIKGSSGGWAGGLVAYIKQGSAAIDSSWNTGEITGNFIGGLVGYLYESPANVTITNCYNLGEIRAGSIGGGLTGHCYQGFIYISKSYNSGEVISSNYAGGLAGYMYDGEISNSFNRGKVSAVNFVGGLTSQIEKGQITNAYNAGVIEGGNTAKGGLVGRKDNGSISDSYYDSETSGQDDTGKGNPLSTVQMKQKTSFENWDFETIWAIKEGISYPYFRTEIHEITISWGSMEFTYTDGAWNPNTHEYDDGGWTAAENANRISIINNTDNPVTISYSYTRETGFENIAGNFTDGTNTIRQYELPAWDDSPQWFDVFLNLSGKLPEIADKKIGSITVTIDGQEGS